MLRKSIHPELCRTLRLSLLDNYYTSSAPCGSSVTFSVSHPNQSPPTHRLFHESCHLPTVKAYILQVPAPACTDTYSNIRTRRDMVSQFYFKESNWLVPNRPSALPSFAHLGNSSPLLSRYPPDNASHTRLFRPRGIYRMYVRLSH